MDVVTYAAAVGAAKRYTDEQGGGGSSDAVKYTEQTLTSAQQAQARENIGAAAASDIPSVIDYSTTEQDTGIKWVDGKSVYQKTYVFDPPVAGGGYNYVSVADVSGLSIDTLISISGVQHDEGGNYIMSLETYSNVGDNMYLRADKSAVMWKSNERLDWMTIKYTKLTT